MGKQKGRVVIERRDPADIGMRDLYIRIDERKEDRLLCGEKFEVSLDPGPHKIKVTNRVFSKIDTFEIVENESVSYSVANIWLKGILIPLFIISGTGAYRVRLRRIAD